MFNIEELRKCESALMECLAQERWWLSESNTKLAEELIREGEYDLAVSLLENCANKEGRMLATKLSEILRSLRHD